MYIYHLDIMIMRLYKLLAVHQSAQTRPAYMYVLYMQ